MDHLGSTSRHNILLNGLEAITLLYQRGDGPLTKSLPNYSCHNDAIYLFTNCTDTNAFRRIIDGNAERSQISTHCDDERTHERTHFR